MGLGLEPSYYAYASTSYGWPFPAVMVEQIACQGPFEEWPPKPSLTWYPLGITLSLLQILAGGLLINGITGRLSKKKRTLSANN